MKKRMNTLRAGGNGLKMEKSLKEKGSCSEYGYYGENNGPIDDWIKRTKDDPCNEMSTVKDKDYEC